MQEKLYLDAELGRFMSMIRDGRNLTLMRFGDSERSLMDNLAVVAQEGRKSPGREISLGYALRDALNLEGENVYYGISCPCCDRKAYYWYMSRVPRRENTTFANIFVNKNYKRFLQEFSTIRRDAVVIANHRGRDRTIGSLNILKYYPVGDQCVDFWENDARRLIESITADFGHRKGLLYVLSAGLMSAPFIAALYRNNPENCYINFGSSIDIYIHGRDTRPHSRSDNKYSDRNCWMFNPAETCFDVSVVLSSYKKPEALRKQLDAVEAQTLKPREIILCQDGIDGDYEITFKPEFLERFSRVFISPSNKGVWERFRLAQNAASQYVCIFDDDTMPGRRWLENCHFHAQLQDGIYGTVGIIVKDPKTYPRRFWQAGWRRPYSRTARVDFAGHSWFMRREYLSWMFEGTEKYQSFKYVGEDMCLSFKALQHGIKTFVPPHPYHDTELWGSMPEYAVRYGTASGSVSMDSGNMRAMTNAMAMFASDGWRFCINESRLEALRVYLGSKLERYMNKLKF